MKGNKNWKRILSMVLTWIMLVSLVPMSVFANDDEFVFTDNVVNYYAGKPNVTEKEIYEAIVASPEYDAEKVTIEYLARPAVNYTVNVSELSIPDRLKPILSGIMGEQLKFEMEALWLGIDETIKESVSMEEAIQTYLNAEAFNELVKVFLSNPFNAKEALTKALEDIYADIKEAVKYAGAHSFGYNATDSETMTETVRITYTRDGEPLVAERVITLSDLRQPSYVEVEGCDATILTYKDYTDEELLAEIGAYVTNGTDKIEGATVSLAGSYEGKKVGEYSVTVKFAGNEEYKPSEAAFNVVIKSACVETFDVPNVVVTYGDAYDMAPTVVLGNKYGETTEVTDSMIRFLIGLDVANVDVNRDGIKGYEGKVQLLLPDGIQTFLGLNNGKNMTLSELKTYLEMIPELVKDDSLVALEQALNAIQKITETGELVITVGGQMPTNIGMYLYGAVTTSSNYNTAIDLAYLVIKPEVVESYLEFNYVDENNIFTWELLNGIDLDASAYDDEACINKNETATELVQNIFFGFDEMGNVVVTKDGTTLGNGAYTQLSFLLETGNTIYFAEPIFRAFIIAPSLADVELEDSEGAKDVFEYEFDNTEKELFVTVNGVKFEDAVVNYYGVQTNGTLYNSTTAPKHAGVYTAVVTYVSRDEAGELVAVGGDAAVIVITPAKSTISVTGGEVKYDGEGHTVKVEIAGAGVNVVPDYTLISGGVTVSGDINEVGLDALHGNVNIDFPAWVDALLAENEFFAEGVDTAYLIDFITSYRDDVVGLVPVDKLVDLCVPVEKVNAIVDCMNAYFDGVLAVLAKLPKDVNLTFVDDVTYTEPGFYFYYGIVTDSDQCVSADTGLLHIYKNVNNFDLLDTTVEYDGNEHWVDMVNDANVDYLGMVIDRENNVVNFILEDDVMYLMNMLGITVPAEFNLSDIYAKLEGEDVEAWVATMNCVVTELKALGLSKDVVAVLDAMAAQLNNLPKEGTILLNGKLPVEIGTYECYAISYSEYYRFEVAKATLEIVEPIPEWAVCKNVQTGEYYAVVATALAEAEAGQTILMLKAAVESVLLVREDITLDLNGVELTASYVAAFNGSNVIDSAENKGLLVAEQNRVMLQETNKQAPVYNGEGYVFADVKFAIGTGVGVNEALRVNFLPAPIKEIVDLLKDGVSDNGVQIVLQLSWKQDNGVSYQDFVYNEEMIQTVYENATGALEDYPKAFYLDLANIEGFEDLTAQVKIVSETGAVVSSKTIALN